MPPSDAPTEQRWIISSIVRDLADMTAAAASPEHWTALLADAVDVHPSAGGEPGLGYALTIRLPGGATVQSDLKVTGSVWSPELYGPMLQALFARLKVTPPTTITADATPPDADLLTALARPLTAEIESRNRQISAWLQDHPLDARAHAQAALLLGTLAMRENAGLFWDPRGLCNRAAAHLALARALRPELSACGETAELLIGLIIDTKADCQQRIAALQARVAVQSELGPWVRAATLRNTRDYRTLADPKAATLRERIECFRALSEAISAEQAIARTTSDEPDTAPDWSRIVLQAGYGVDSGHRFASPSTGLEIKDAALVLPEIKQAHTPDQYAAIFNPPPGGAVQSGNDGRAHWHVIDRGTWARYFQRHLLQAADSTYDFLQNKWGVPDEANQFRTQVAPLLSGLTLYPLCLEHLGQPERATLVPRAADLLTRHPEWVSDYAWSVMVKNAPGRAWPAVSQAWFSPRLPTGTVYGYDWRVTRCDYLPPATRAELTKCHDIAPLKYSVCWNYITELASDHHATIESFKTAMGALPSYYLPAIWGEAYLVQNDPVPYASLLNQAGALDPDYYLVLGKYYQDHHQEPQAAQAYQMAIDHQADAVALSNQCDWLVNYYYDHGQQDRAMTIARQAAEVYSARGLETMAELQEKMGRDPEAESYYQKLQERYASPGPLISFYGRAAARNAAYAQKLKAMEHGLFPRGMELVNLPQLSGKPADGVLVHGSNERSRQSGLATGAIVVSLDGKRVHNREQYDYVRALSSSPAMELVVYQNEHYQTLHATIPGRRFDLDFTSWP